MNIRTTSSFDKKLKKKISKKPKLKDKISKQTKLLTQNIKHPSLKVHKLKGSHQLDYAFWIEDDLRIIFKIIDNNIIFTNLITHDEY